MTRMRILAMTTLLVLGGCGASEPEAPADDAPTAQAPEAVVRARLEALWVAAASDDPAALAPYLTYAGPDRERRYREAAQLEGEQVQAIHAVRGRIQRHLALGAATFERFETRSKRDQEWLAWHVTFGEGDAAKAVLYAFVKADGTWLLGDID